MPKFKIMQADAYKVEIFIGGDFATARSLCRDYCDEVGLCVTIEPTTYVFRGDDCEGVRVGLIEYARIPRGRSWVFNTADDLAKILLDGLGQGSYTVQDDTTSLFYTERPEDGCEP